MDGLTILFLLATIGLLIIAVGECRRASKLESRCHSMRQELNGWRELDARVQLAVRIEPHNSVSVKEMRECL